MSIIQTKPSTARGSAFKQHKSLTWRYFVRHAILVAIGFAVIITGVLIQYNSNHILPILRVSVIGSFHHVDKQAFNAAVRQFTRGSLLNVDVAGIQNAGKVLPWVDKVQVTRVWPDSLRLIVSERVAVARWGKHGLVSADGDMFTPDKRTLPTDLPVLNGPEDSYRLLTRHYLQISSMLEREGLIISHLLMNERHAWSMTLHNGIKVLFGRPNDDSEQRFQRFLMVYGSVLAAHQSQIAAIDMRYPNGVSVSWKQGIRPDFNGMV